MRLTCSAATGSSGTPSSLSRAMMSRSTSIGSPGYRRCGGNTIAFFAATRESFLSTSHAAA